MLSDWRPAYASIPFPYLTNPRQECRSHSVRSGGDQRLSEVYAKEPLVRSCLMEFRFGAWQENCLSPFSKSRRQSAATSNERLTCIFIQFVQTSLCRWHVHFLRHLYYNFIIIFFLHFYNYAPQLLQKNDEERAVLTACSHRRASNLEPIDGPDKLHSPAHIQHSSSYWGHLVGIPLKEWAS